MPETHYWVHTLDPVLLPIYGNFAIRYYGLAYMLAFVIGYFMLRSYVRKKILPVTPDQFANIITALLLGVILGGRLGYILLYSFPAFLSDPLILFKVWQGGMSSHGGFIGVLIALGWASKRYHLSFLKLNDLMCTIVPPGLFLGRIANFINGELWGKITTVPWAVIFPHSMPGGGPIASIPPRHPSQIYEALLEGLLLFLYTQVRMRRSQVLSHSGRLAGEFLCLYALVRIFCEQFREPDASLILGMSRGIFYSLFLILLGLGYIWNSHRKTVAQK